MHAKEGERRDKGGATKDERGPLHVERDNLPRMQMQFLARALLPYDWQYFGCKK